MKTGGTPSKSEENEQVRADKNELENSSAGYDTSFRSRVGERVAQVWCRVSFIVVEARRRSTVMR